MSPRRSGRRAAAPRGTRTTGRRVSRAAIDAYIRDLPSSVRRQIPRAVVEEIILRQDRQIAAWKARLLFVSHDPPFVGRLTDFLGARQAAAGTRRRRPVAGKK